MARSPSELDLDVHTTGQVEFHQRVDGLGARAVDVDDTTVGAGFEVLTGILVDVRRAQHAVDLPLGGQGNRTDRRGGSVIGGFDDFFAGQIQHAAIEGLQADADLLLGDGGGHRIGSAGKGRRQRR